MSERLLLPPHYRDIGEETPLVFLAGPVQGAPDWQTPTAERLLDANDKIFVASPRRPSMGRKLNKGEKREQGRWELNHIKLALEVGGVAFWFAAQDHTIPYEAGRAFAQTSRFELGAVSMAQMMDPGIMSWVGFDPAYTKNGGGSQGYMEIAREWFVGYDQIYDSLDEMVDDIIKDVAEL